MEWNNANDITDCRLQIEIVVVSYECDLILFSKNSQEDNKENSSSEEWGTKEYVSSLHWEKYIKKKPKQVLEGQGWRGRYYTKILSFSEKMRMKKLIRTHLSFQNDFFSDWSYKKNYAITCTMPKLYMIFQLVIKLCAKIIFFCYSSLCGYECFHHLHKCLILVAMKTTG